MRLNLDQKPDRSAVEIILKLKMQYHNIKILNISYRPERRTVSPICIIYWSFEICKLWFELLTANLFNFYVTVSFTDFTVIDNSTLIIHNQWNWQITSKFLRILLDKLLETIKNRVMVLFIRLLTTITQHYFDIKTRDHLRHHKPQGPKIQVFFL